MKRVSVLLVMLIAAFALLSAQSREKIKAYSDGFYGSDPSLIKLSECLPYYRQNGCEELMRKEVVPFGYYYMGPKARLGDTLDFHYSVDSHHSAYDLPIEDCNGYRLSYRNGSGKILSLVATRTTMLFVKDRKSREIQPYIRLFFPIEAGAEWVPALSKRTAEDALEVYTTLDGCIVRYLHPDGDISEWTDFFIERAADVSHFKDRPRADKYISCGKEVTLDGDACIFLDKDGDMDAEVVVVYEPGF